MRLRTVMLGSVLALVAITIAATALTVQLVFERSTRAALDRKLEVHRQIFLGMLAQHQALLAREAKILADEPRLKAVLGGDVDRATVVGVARDIMAMVRSDLFLVIDSEGLLVVDLLDPAVSGVDMMGDVLIAEAFHQGGSSGMWTADSGLYEVQAQRVRAGPHIVGAVVIGRRIDDTMATSLQRRTGTSLLILHRDGRPQLDRGVDGDRIQLEHSAIVASPLPGVGDVDRAGIAAAVAAQLERSGAAPVAGGAAGLGSMTIGEAEFATLSARFPGSYRGSDPLTYVVLENIDTALAPSHRVTRILGAIALVVFLAAIILAMMLTRQLSDPIDRLVELTEHLAAGDLSARAKSCGFVEVSQLGVAMNRMASELEQSRYTLAEKQRLENELDIAHRIQTSIVPDGIELPGLTVAARMETAELVGGDYYDLQPASDGGWIAIGDVAGHGLQAG
ncbi:MAG: HAMP domain-containing protein, partial [Myxococcota bacterium]